MESGLNSVGHKELEVTPAKGHGLTCDFKGPFAATIAASVRGGDSEASLLFLGVPPLSPFPQWEDLLLRSTFKLLETIKIPLVKLSQKLFLEIRKSRKMLAPLLILNIKKLQYLSR